MSYTHSDLTLRACTSTLRNVCETPFLELAFAECFLFSSTSLKHYWPSNHKLILHDEEHTAN